MRAALVVDLPHGRTFTALRGGGAAVDGLPLVPTGCRVPGEALVDGSVVEALKDDDDDLHFEPAGRRMLKGFDAPVAVWSLVSDG